MRVVLFCEALTNRAGIERMTVELANLLSDTCETYIVTIDKFEMSKSPYPILPKVNVISMNSHFGKSIKKFDILNISNIIEFRKLCKEIRPEVVITVATPLARITAPALIGLNIKNIGWEHFNVFAGSKIGAVYKLISTWFVDKTVVLTERDAKDFKRFKSPGVVAIPNFTTIGSDSEPKFGNKILLAVGRHSYQKGFDMLLRAWGKARPSGWTLKIVGSGELKDENMGLAKELGVMDSVIFMESTPDIKSEFENASCFVLSSRFEGLVLVLIEAKMMGLPSICFDCPNSPGEVIRDGEDGWLVTPESVGDLAAEMLKRLNDDTSELRRAGAAAKQDAEERYSKDAVKSCWLNLLDTITK